MLNDGGEFERSSREMFPPEPELKKENDINIGSFLHLSNKIKDKSFPVGL